MSDCMGKLPVTTKVDRGMKEFIEREAEKRAVTRAEAIRRMLDTYRHVHHGQVDCPGCGSGVEVRMDA